MPKYAVLQLIAFAEVSQTFVTLVVVIGDILSRQ
jgi:hypothetical protein